MPWKSPVSGGRSFIFDLSPPGIGVVPSVVGQVICESSCMRLHQDIGMERVRTGLEGIDHPVMPMLLQLSAFDSDVFSHAVKAK
eukprot:8576386-Alexandrium_andersonii.AAC.1